jgi:hypothetical protein
VEPDAAELREGVRDAYSMAASNPGKRHPFPVGEEFALSLGYPRRVLDKIPALLSEASPEFLTFLFLPPFQPEQQLWMSDVVQDWTP